jgi:hypothetical protein
VHVFIASLQSAGALHATHEPLSPLHTGVAPVHAPAFEVEHATHAPALGPLVSQAVPFGLPVHSESDMQPRHIDAPVSQTGFGLAHPSVGVQAPQVCAVVLHFAGAVQFASVLHWTHWPFSASVDVSHTPIPHCASLVQAPHVPEVQIGAAALQSEFITHATQVFVDVSQIGVAPEQSVLARHWTHVNELVSHFGFDPVHALEFVPSHWTQAPLFEPDVSQMSPAAHSPDVAHARQTSPPALLQTGVVPLHWELVRHCTHLPRSGSPAVVAQYGVDPVQPHAPLSSDATQVRHVDVTAPVQIG